MSVVTDSGDTVLTAENTFSSPIYVPKGARCPIKIAGTWVGTVTLQFDPNQEGSYEDQKNWTANPTETEYFDAPMAGNLRIGFKTGGFTSGSATVRARFDYPVNAQG